MKTNLWKETVVYLGKYGKKWSDVLFVTGDDFRIANFEELAKRTEYNNGFGKQEIATDLKIVGKDWWLERYEYDGAEEWAFKQMPPMFDECKEVTSLVGMWDTLKEIDENQEE